MNYLTRDIDKLESSNLELKETLAQKEESLMNLSSEKILTEVILFHLHYFLRIYGCLQQLDASVKTRLQSEKEEKVKELALETSQRKKLEKVLQRPGKLEVEILLVFYFREFVNNLKRSKR